VGEPVDLKVLNDRLAIEPTYPLDKDFLAVRFFLDRPDMASLAEEARLYRAAKIAWRRFKAQRGGRVHAFECSAHQSDAPWVCVCSVSALDQALS